jgi:DNA polymerase (family X)
MIHPIPPHQEPFPKNGELADRLEEIAELLDAQEANPYRAQAYRTAAETVRGLDRPVRDILAQEGPAGLMELPGIGRSLARSLERLSKNSRLPLLEQLRAVYGPEEKIASVPGIGRKTAARIHDALGVENLADLQAAAYDGRLTQVPGIGAKRLRAVRESLAGRFRRPPRTSLKPQPTDPATIEEILSVDEEYRRKAEADRLLRIAPRRFNPSRKAWLPILRTDRGEHDYTALYSNSARAHELDAVFDWVVIYRTPQSGGGQWTVMTSRFGPLQGKRIIRGLEKESADSCTRRGAIAE